MVLLAPSPKAINKLLQICDHYASLFDIIFNTDKTYCMFFWPRKYAYKHFPVFKLQGDVLSYLDEFKYLGVLIHSNLKDNAEILRRTRKMYALGNMVISKFKNCQDMCKILMFKTYCSNLYGCALWSDYNVTSYQRVKVAYNDIYRLLLGVRRGPNHSISMLFVQHNVNPLETVIRIATHSLMSRVLRSENRLVASLRESSARVHSALWHRWGIVLRQDARQDLLN